MNDTRKEGRLPVSLVARYREPTMQEPREGECRDISPSGMFLMTPRPSPRGALIRFECTSQTAEDNFRGTGRVVWQRNKSDPRGAAGMGIRFVRLETGGREAVLRIVEQAQVERERSRSESGRRTSSGPPPRVRSAPAMAEAAPILPTAGVQPPASVERIPELRSPTLRGLGAQSDAPPKARTNANSPLPPGSSARAPGFASTLLSGGSPLPPRSPLPPAPSGTAAAPMPPRTPLPPAREPGRISSPLPPGPEARQGGTGELRERLDRTRRGVGASSPVVGGSSGQKPRSASAKAGDPVVRTTETRAIAGSDRPVGTAASGGSTRPQSDGPPVAARTNHSQRPILNRTSDRPPRPGGVDDLRPSRTPLPPPPAVDNPHPEPDGPNVTPTPAQDFRQAAPARGAFGTPLLLADPDSDADAGRKSSIGLFWLVLGSGLAASIVLARLFGSAPAAISLGSGEQPDVESAKAAPPSPSQTPDSPLEPADGTPVGQGPKDRIPLKTPVTEAIAGPDRAPATADEAVPGHLRATALNPPVTSVAERTARAPTRAMSAKTPGGAPTRQNPLATITAAPSPQPSAPQAPNPPSPVQPPPSPAPAEPTAQKAPLDQALDCLAQGDNRCVIRALEDKARSARELELLIETYRAVGSTPRAEREMKRYLDGFPNGQRATEYKHLLERHGPSTEPKVAPGP